LVLADYQIGVGIADMTGPSVEVNFMGYANPSQTGRGIHMRLFSRAFIVDDGTKRTVFVSIDGGMASDLVTKHVIEKVQSSLGDNSTYTYDNVCISGTHSHSGPAGFLQYTLFQFTSFGFVKECFDGWVQGIADSILQAHKNLQPGKIFLAQGDLVGANINRSPTSYLLNPSEERDRYDANTDTNMILLRFVSQSGEDIGVLNWFAVHGTSMNNTNKLISGDNRGYASYLLEQHFNGPSRKVQQGKGSFVAAFASSNLGDVSPNTKGPHCMDTGLPCDTLHSSCNGRNEMCVASGPGKDMFESTEIIGQKQYDHALKLMQSATVEVKGPIDFRHAFRHMTGLNVTLDDGSTGTLCTPAMGYAFAAGTTDGPGAFDFTQGTNSSNPFWNAVAGLLSKPTKEQIACQAPKPILLNTGAISTPYDWDPHTSPVQILRIGQVFILAVPVELTTMAGRRVRDALAKILQPLAGETPAVVTPIAGLANSYASYTTTFEEYQGQRYEAGSTIYGPHALQGWIQELSAIANDMKSGSPSKSDPAPPDNLSKMLELLPGVIFDAAPLGKKFGDVTMDASKSYKVGDIATVKFQAGNPRNDQRLGNTFLTIEKQNSSNEWDMIFTDADWATKFTWIPHSEITGISEVQIDWEIDSNEESGTYRICHTGAHKNLLGKITPYSGCSSSFTLTS